MRHGVLWTTLKVTWYTLNNIKYLNSALQTAYQCATHSKCHNIMKTTPNVPQCFSTVFTFCTDLKGFVFDLPTLVRLNVLALQLGGLVEQRSQLLSQFTMFGLCELWTRLYWPLFNWHKNELRPQYCTLYDNWNHLLHNDTGHNQSLASYARLACNVCTAW